jgi:hypothetical protein
MLIANSTLVSSLLTANYFAGSALGSMRDTNSTYVTYILTANLFAERFLGSMRDTNSAFVSYSAANFFADQAHMLISLTLQLISGTIS